MPAQTYVGTSGWSYDDWKGVVYPARPPRGFHGLAYLSQFFDTVEVNTSFYRPPNPRYCEGWLERVQANPRFQFTMKLWQRFTHERETPWTERETAQFKESVAPVTESGRLGALLVQFPWSFRYTPRNQDWLRRISEDFAEYPLALEVRHVSWHCDDALDAMKQQRLNFCNIDQPVTRTSIGPTNISTGPIAYYRFHGRNRDAWFDRTAGRDKRYDYLYSPSELDPWVESIQEMEKRVEQIYVMTNNHFRGQAPVNALQIKAALAGARVKVPAGLIEYYPVLRGVAED